MPVKENAAPKTTKSRYQYKSGLFGDATDYNVYILSKKELVIGFLIGFALGFCAMWIVYDVPKVACVLGIGAGMIGIPVYREYLRKKRRDNLMIQFRDMLESLTASLRTGRNSRNSFMDAEADLISQYGSDADIVREVQTIILGINNGYREEVLLNDFAERSGMEDVRTFALIFGVTNRTGGDISQIIEQTHDIISQKMSIEMEIQTTITETKSQMNIMLVMPFVIILMLRYMGNADIVNNTPLNIIVKTVAMGIFAASYFIGQKIADIKV